MSNSGILSDQINDLLATPSGKLFVGGYRTLQTFESNNWVDLGFTSNIGFSERTYSFAIDNDGWSILPQLRDYLSLKMTN